MNLFVPGIPAPQGSKRHVGNGIMVESSKKVGPWRERVALFAADRFQGLEPMEGPLNVTCTFQFPRPKSHYNSKGLKKDAPHWVTKKPDADKLLRAVLDALTGIVFKDDSQVVRLLALKHFNDEHVGVWIQVDRIATTNQGEESDGTAHTRGADR